ncbi:replication protein A 14 kDa subunit B-like [Cucurbita maxima]|uniref:Replication protein A 14 kDa subunit B-like n=1 Tax=Cucurbita maxima TaxID=3661 RepID=A0A6J1J6J3_CUCMA|nr:replication protein A 14 kDa subunit B-like [Cucurbita maxima]
MDTSNPSVFVNAELLRMYVGRRVRAVIQVQSEGNGVIYGKSTDDNQITVKGSPPFSLSKFVEVIGIADTDKSIRADVWTNFGDSFDTSTFNQLCQLANGEFKPLFV